ncbi:MAG: hypothetical protein CBD74_06485 [Saprospirales bacterium TMED214]|nr:MAG: hypothetical protein CBD74_06485 [Saprospirales bacterium TMED214]
MFGNPKENVLRKSAARDTSSVFRRQSDHQPITSTSTPSSMAAEETCIVQVSRITRRSPLFCPATPDLLFSLSFNACAKAATADLRQPENDSFHLSRDKKCTSANGTESS